MKKVNIIKSESWPDNFGLMEQHEILNSAINELMEDTDRIINIQLVEELGMKRFWIYTQEA